MSDIDKHRKILLRFCRVCGSCDRSIDQLPIRKTDSEFVTSSLKFLNVDLNTFTFKNEDPDIFPYFICYICYRKLNYFENIVKQGKNVNKINIATFERHSDNCNVCLRKQTKVTFECKNDKLSDHNVLELCPEANSMPMNGSHINLDSTSECNDSTNYVNQDIKTGVDQDEPRFNFNSSPRLIMALSPENPNEAAVQSECRPMTDRKLKVLDTGEINAKIMQVNANKSIEENFMDDDNGIKQDDLCKNSEDSLIIIEKENEDPLCFGNSDLASVKKEEISELESTSSVNIEVENLVVADSSVSISRSSSLNHDLSHEDRLAYFCRLCGQMKIGISESSIGLLKTSQNVQKHIRKILQVNVFDEPSSIYPPAVCLECCDMLKSNFLSLSACRKLNNLDLKIVAFEPHHDKSCFICSAHLPLQCCNESSIYEEKSGKFFPVSHKEVIMQTLNSEDEGCTSSACGNNSIKDINTKVIVNSSSKCLKRASVSKYFKNKFASQKMKIKFAKTENKSNLKLGKLAKLKETDTLSKDKYFGETKTMDDNYMHFKWNKKPFPKHPNDNSISKKSKTKIFNDSSGAPPIESYLNKNHTTITKMQANVEMSSVCLSISDDLVTKVSKSNMICKEVPNTNLLHKTISVLEKSDIESLWEEERRKAFAIMNEIFLKISEKVGENFDQSTFKELICPKALYGRSDESVEKVKRMIFVLSQILKLLNNVLKGDKFNNCSKEGRRLEPSFESCDSESKSYSVCTGLLNLGNECFSQTTDIKCGNMSWLTENPENKRESISTNRENSDSCYNLGPKHNEIYIDCAKKNISNNLIQVTHPIDKKIKLDSLSGVLDSSLKENNLRSYQSSIAINEKLLEVDLPADLSSIEADVVSYLASSKLQNSSSQAACSPSSSLVNNECENIPKCSLLFNNSILSHCPAKTTAAATTVANGSAGGNSSYIFNDITISHCGSASDQTATLNSNFESILHSNHFEEKVEMLSETVPNSYQRQVISESFEHFLSDDEDMLCPEVIEKLMMANHTLSHPHENELNHYTKSDLEYSRAAPIIISQTPESVTISIPENMDEPISDVSTLQPELQQFANISDIQSLLNESNPTTKDNISNDSLPLILEKSSVASISQKDFKAINNDCTLCVDKLIETPKKSSKKVVVKKHQCPVCAKFFRKPCDVKRHLRTHTGEKPFKCEFCDRTFSVQATLRMHQKLHMENRLIHCDVCSASFNNLGLLNSHKKSHESSLYPCLFCPHKFIDSHHWKSHVNIHHSREISIKDLVDDNNVASIKIPSGTPLKISSTEIAAIAKCLGTSIIPSNDSTQKKVDLNNENVDIENSANINSGVNLTENTGSKSGKNNKKSSLSTKFNANVTQQENSKASSDLGASLSVAQKSIAKRSRSSSAVKKCDYPRKAIENVKCKKSYKMEKWKNDKKISRGNFKILNYHKNEPELPTAQKFCYNESRSLSNLYQAIVGESIEEDNAKNTSLSVGNMKAHVLSNKCTKFTKPYDIADLQLQNTDKDDVVIGKSYDSEQSISSSIPQITLENSDHSLIICKDLEYNYANQSEITVNTDGSYSLEKKSTGNPSTNSQNAENSLDDSGAVESYNITKESDKCFPTKRDVKFKLKNALGCELKVVEVKSEKITKSKKKIDKKIDEATQQLRERGINVEPVFEQTTLADSISSSNVNLKNSHTNSLIVQVGVKEVGWQQMKGNKLKQEDKLENFQSLDVKPMVASVTTGKCNVNETKLDDIESKADQKGQIYNLQNDDSTSLINCVKSDYLSEKLLHLKSITHPQKLPIIKPNVKRNSCEDNKVVSVMNNLEDDIGETGIQLSNNIDEIRNKKTLSISMIDSPIKNVASSICPVDVGNSFPNTSQLKSDVDEKYCKKIKLDVLQPNVCNVVPNSNELNYSESITLEKSDSATAELKVPLVMEEEDSIVISWAN